MTSFVAASLVLLAAASPSQDDARALSGKRLVLKGASCAGMAFTSQETLELYAELECSHAATE